MEDFLGLILILIFYLFSAFSDKSKNKKKTKRRQATIGSLSREKQADPWQMQRDSSESSERPRRIKHDTEAKQAKPDADCGKKPIHLHDVSPFQMEMAQEGEDPCHAGGMELADELPVETGETHEAQQTMAQDMLRGVIMSEILARPCDRRRMNGRR